ncbi:MAG: putative membrane protein [Halieaceae bacterium]|jgi:uncharacterized membrane protein
MALISQDNVFALGAIIFALAWLGFWIDNHPIGQKTSGVVWVLVGGMVLSNFNIIPLASPVYGFVGGSLVPLAIPLLLLKGDLRKIFRESGGVMISFFIASMATVAGVVLGFFLLDLGEIGPKVAGVYAGGWIGGAVNFLAVSQAVEMTPTEFSVSISASSVVSIAALMLLIVIPSLGWITKWVPELVRKADEVAEQAAVKSDEVPFRLTHVTGALAISFAICAAAQMIAAALAMTQYNILFITVITIAVANLFPQAMSKLEGEFELGMLLMYLFFAIVGAGTDATSFLADALVLFFYGMIIIVTHLALVLVAARFLKIDLAEAIVASAAALVGPAVTAAIAISKGWKHLVTPGIMCGIFGYVIATFIGVTITAFLS